MHIYIVPVYILIINIFNEKKRNRNKILLALKLTTYIRATRVSHNYAGVPEKREGGAV